MPILAEFDSDCEFCGDEIEAGTEIEADDGYGWVHKECKDEIDSED